MHQFEDELATFDAELNNYNKPVDHSKVLGIQHDKDGKLLVGEMNPGSGDQLKPDKGDIDQLLAQLKKESENILSQQTEKGADVDIDKMINDIDNEFNEIDDLLKDVETLNIKSNEEHKSLSSEEHMSNASLDLQRKRNAPTD